MNHSLLLQGPKVQLLNQLLFFDEGLASFLSGYYPEPGPERLLVERILKQYTSVVESILQTFSMTSLQSCALIGSHVTVSYPDEGDFVESYTIVFPGEADPDRNYISFLSPMGMQLLMAKPRETLELEIPSGTLSVYVQDIRYHCSEISD
ncbi:GreA/GreB family elongation factor ['Paenibacillus yunnanensis' Narsing Rao et al. 2020]|uniref:GreA/GreB family elongation factor n=1 Tax=Paenibacillus tengchongensis TaxID=2608684 RepID=UPI00124ED159|nr:GreA/GreB family elongation factor [Paenibacillus tengchongensis]